MLSGDSVPKIIEGAEVRTALNIMNNKKLGVLLVVSDDDKLKGILTDGDLRRMIIHKKDIYKHTLNEMMIKNPKAIGLKSALYEALNIMENYQITVLPVIDETGRVSGVLHLHDILGKGTIQFNAVH